MLLFIYTRLDTPAKVNYVLLIAAILSGSCQAACRLRAKLCPVAVWSDQNGESETEKPGTELPAELV